VDKGNSHFPPLQYKTFVLARGTVHYEVRTHFAMYDIRALEYVMPYVSPRRPGFDPRPVNLGFVMDPVDAEFVVDEVALERVLLPWLLRCSHAFHGIDCLHSISRLSQTLI
jgi:hypothetical protein